MMTQEEMKKAADTYKTPLYLFDMDVLKETVERLRELLGKELTLCYAMKANPFLTAKMVELVEYIEVCSPGELRICEELKIPMEQVILSGVLKEEEDIRHLLSSCEKLPVFTAESEKQADMLCQLAAAYKKQIKVLLRMTSGNQFGMGEETLYHVIDEMKEHPYAKIRGLHFYSGTQKRKAEQMKKELEMLDDFCGRVKKELGVEIEHLEYGPGFGVEYFVTAKEQKDADGTDMVCSVRNVAQKLTFGGNVTFEMGRYLAAMCGCYLTKVREVKENCGVRYCLVDGGLHHLNYDGQVMAMRMPYCRQIPERDARKEPCQICGALCTVNDILISQYPLSEVCPGDYLVFERTGAYSMTEGMSLFLSRNLPGVAAYSRERGFELLRKQTPIYVHNMPRK